MSNIRTVPSTPSSVTGALLHDLGKIVLGAFVDVDGMSIMGLACRDSIPVEEAERKFLGIDRSKVGAILFESWNLSCSEVDVVRWHHRPEHSTRNQLAVGLVQAANITILESGLGGGERRSEVPDKFRSSRPVTVDYPDCRDRSVYCSPRSRKASNFF